MEDVRKTIEEDQREEEMAALDLATGLVPFMERMRKLVQQDLRDEIENVQRLENEWIEARTRLGRLSRAEYQIGLDIEVAKRIE